MVGTGTNSRYWREFAVCAREQAGAVLVRFELQNSSPFALTHGKLEVTGELDGEMVPMLQQFNFESPPYANGPFLGMKSLMEQQLKEWEKELAWTWWLAGRLPSGGSTSSCLGEHRTCDHVLAFFPPRSGRLEVRARLLAADQPPVSLRSAVSVEVEERQIDFADLQQLAASGTGRRKRG